MPMDKKEFEEVIQKFEQNSSPFALDLSAQNIDGAQITQLAKAIAKSETLLHLNLSSNQIGVEGAHALAEALEVNRSLQSLYLTNNQVGDEGAIALAKVLKEKNQILHKLCLEGNAVGDLGAASLAELVKKLRYLNLRLNEIGDMGAIALANALEQHPKLHYLNLERNLIGDEGAMALAHALEKTDSLKTLNLEVNQVGDAGAVALSQIKEYLARNCVRRDLLVETINELLEKVRSSLKPLKESKPEIVADDEALKIGLFEKLIELKSLDIELYDAKESELSSLLRPYIIHHPKPFREDALDYPIYLAENLSFSALRRLFEDKPRLATKKLKRKTRRHFSIKKSLTKVGTLIVQQEDVAQAPLQGYLEVAVNKASDPHRLELETTLISPMGETIVQKQTLFLNEQNQFDWAGSPLNPNLAMTLQDAGRISFFIPGTYDTWDLQANGNITLREMTSTNLCVFKTFADIETAGPINVQGIKFYARNLNCKYPIISNSEVTIICEGEITMQKEQLVQLEPTVKPERPQAEFVAGSAASAPTLASGSSASSVSIPGEAMGSNLGNESDDIDPELEADIRQLDSSALLKKYFGVEPTANPQAEPVQTPLSEIVDGIQPGIGGQGVPSEASEHEFGFPPDDTISTLYDEPHHSDSDYILSLERQVRELRLSSALRDQSLQTSLDSILSLGRLAERREQERAVAEAARIAAEARAAQAENARLAAETTATADLAGAEKSARAQAELVRSAAEAAREVAVRTAVAATEVPLRARITTLEATEAQLKAQITEMEPKVVMDIQRGHARKMQARLNGWPPPKP